MSYTCQYLQFGSNQNRVPGYEEDLSLNNMPNAPIPMNLVDSSYPPGPIEDALWSLVFSYENGNFYRTDQEVPGQDGAVIKSWYAKGGGGENHYLSIRPFITGEGEFAEASGFIIFRSGNKQLEGDYSVCTDHLPTKYVTAEIARELPGFETIKVSVHSTNNAIITKMTVTKAVFDHFFIYAGEGTVDDNMLKVESETSCYALAVYKIEISTTTTETGTYQIPRIPETEWPMLIGDLVKDIITNGQGELCKYISRKNLAAAGPEVLKKAVSSLDTRIRELEKVRKAMEGLSGKKPD
ncbi:MAG: hypothetical protein JW874_07475 [Spirochaetales bacterium]|nr:hypothetical protein [Spirochaetales bacterium]